MLVQANTAASHTVSEDRDIRIKGTVSKDQICTEMVWLKMPCFKHAAPDY
jgi:hypothetical protein